MNSGSHAHIWGNGRQHKTTNEARDGAAPASQNNDLSHCAAEGAFWNVLFTLLTKVISFATQVWIAWFLTPHDLGLVAIATSIVGVTSILLGTHLQKVLIQQSGKFHEYASQVFWLSLTMNTLVAVSLAATAPFVSRAFGQRHLTYLLWIIAVSLPIMALPVTYSAKLLIELRFRFVSACSFGEGLARNLLAVVFAALGFGSESILIPLAPGAIFAAVVQRLGAGRIIQEGPKPSRWRVLLRPGVWLMAHSFFASVTGYGTSIIIAAQHSTAITGLYFWGSSMAAQAVFLIATNLQGVFFPVFSKLEKTDLQRQFFEKVLAISCLCVWPVCLMQVLLATPLLRVLFAERWQGAAPVVQWLSVGMLTQPFNTIGGALLMSRGQFRNLTFCAGVTAFGVLSAAWIGCRMGDQASIAGAVGLFTLVANTFPSLLAVRSLGGNPGELINVCRPPIIVALLTSLAVLPISILSQRSPPIVTLVTVTMVCACAHGFLVSRLTPELWAMILDYARSSIFAKSRLQRG